MEKARIRQVLDAMPDEVDIDALLERLHLLNKVQIAENELAQGKGISHEDAKKRLRPWLQ
jgi:hypothetical protein